MDQEFKNMCELWKQIQKESNIRQILEKNKKKAQQTIQQFTHRFEYDSSKIAELLWKNTYRGDWKDIVIQEKIDGLDILDMTLNDVMSLSYFNGDNGIYAMEFFIAIIEIRDKITQPIAQLIYLLDPQGSPDKDWILAQKLLIDFFEAKKIC